MTDYELLTDSDSDNDLTQIVGRGEDPSNDMSFVLLTIINSKGQQWQCEAYLSDTIRSVKEKQFGNAAGIDFVYEGVTMRDDLTLSDYNVKAVDHLRVVDKYNKKMVKGWDVDYEVTPPTDKDWRNSNITLKGLMEHVASVPEVKSSVDEKENALAGKLKLFAQKHKEARRRPLYRDYTRNRRRYGLTNSDLENIKNGRPLSPEVVPPSPKRPRRYRSLEDQLRETSTISDAFQH